MYPRTSIKTAAAAITQGLPSPWNGTESEADKLLVVCSHLLKVKEEQKVICEDMKKMKKQMASGHAAQLSTAPLPVPASREECFTAVQKLLRENDEFNQKWRVEREEAVRRLKNFQQTTSTVTKAFERLDPHLGHPVFVEEYVWTLLNMHAWASKMLSSPSLDLQEKAESQRLQARIYELLEDHEASLRRSVWLEADNFSRHLDRKEPKSAVPVS